MRRRLFGMFDQLLKRSITKDTQYPCTTPIPVSTLKSIPVIPLDNGERRKRTVLATSTRSTRRDNGEALIYLSTP